MSLRTVAYTPEGRAIKVDEGASYARLQGIGGAPIQTLPGWREKPKPATVRHRNSLLDAKHDPKPTGRPRTLPDGDAIDRLRASWRRSAAKKRAAKKKAA